MELIRRWSLKLIDPHDMIDIRVDDTYIKPGNAGYRISPHTHEFYELEYVLSGSGVQHINGKYLPVSRGDTIFFDIGDIHDYYSTGKLLIINVVFHPRYWDAEIQNKILRISKSEITRLNRNIHLSGSAMIFFEELIDKIERELKNKEQEYQIAVKGYFNLFLVTC